MWHFPLSSNILIAAPNFEDSGHFFHPEKKVNYVPSDPANKI